MFNTKAILLGCVAIVILVLGYFLMRANVSVKFYNKTGHDVDSLIIGDTFVGHISNNDSTGYIKFRKFNFDSGIPYEKTKGNIQKKVWRHYFWSWCGTERSKKANGTYAFDLKTTIILDTAYVYLDNHNGHLFNFH